MLLNVNELSGTENVLALHTNGRCDSQRSFFSGLVQLSNCNLFRNTDGVLWDEPMFIGMRFSYPPELDSPHPRNCPRVRLLHMIAASPAAAHRVDWLQEVKDFPGANDSKSDLLTSLSVTQAKSGDGRGARATANGHRRLRHDAEEPYLDEVLAMAYIGVAEASRGDLEAAFELVKRATEQCSSSPWCAPSSHSGYRGTLEFAFARVAVEYAKRGDFDTAKSVIEFAARETGDGTNDLNWARFRVAVMLAEAGRIFETVAVVRLITDTETESAARKKIESMFIDADIRAKES